VILSAAWRFIRRRDHRGYTAALTRAATSAFLIALSGCAGKEPPPLDNSFCRLYVALPDPSDAVNMKKRENKLAVLTNEQTNDRECRLGDRSKSLHPR
jgi:hypothetical protein